MNTAVLSTNKAKLEQAMKLMDTMMVKSGTPAPVGADGLDF